MKIRHTIRFYLNDQLVELDDIPPQQTVLDFLRLDRGLRGTKEGCAEGDCGACTVLLGQLDAAGELAYRTINACIRLTASLDGTHLLTIEQLSGGDGASLHPVQRAMVEHHGSQCGFCTPGIVMSLYGQWLENPAPSVDDVERTLQGNLCRCTGYAPIIRAAQAVGSYGDVAQDPLVAGARDMAAKLAALADDARIEIGTGAELAILPATADDLADVLEANPEATIIAGATDVGLWVTKFMRDLGTVVFLSRVRELQRISVADGKLVIGAGISYADAEETIAGAIPALTPLLSRIGGEQVRHAGTIGGNIANGSPIGDTPPALIALGATISLRRGKARREMALEDYFIAYGKQARQPGEFIENISAPLPSPEDRYAVHKVSKRFDEDISSVLGAFRVRVVDGFITEAVLAYGGMAATPKRGRAAEAALVGHRWSRAAFEAAKARLAEDFQPLSDWRASAEYRLTVAGNLLLRFWSETEDGRNISVREVSHA